MITYVIYCTATIYQLVYYHKINILNIKSISEPMSCILVKEFTLTYEYVCYELVALTLKWNKEH